MPPVEVQRAADSLDLPADALIESWVAAALSPALVDAELVVRIVDEPEGRSLNAQYRGRDYPTNVLSFPYEDLTGHGQQATWGIW